MSVASLPSRARYHRQVVALDHFRSVGRLRLSAKHHLNIRQSFSRSITIPRLYAAAHEEEDTYQDFETDKKKGTVKWFDSKKGYGFISPEDGSGDIFVHQSNIKSTGYRALRDGEPVEYKLDDEDGRIRAVEVTGPNDSEPLGSSMEDPFNVSRKQEAAGRYSSEPFTGLGRFSSGLQVVVHNLPWSVSSERLMEKFAEYGAVEADIQYDEMGRSRGYGVVKFDQKEDAERAIEEIHMTEFDGRNIMVRFDRYG